MLIKVLRVDTPLFDKDDHLIHDFHSVRAKSSIKCTMNEWIDKHYHCFIIQHLPEYQLASHSLAFTQFDGIRDTVK